MRVLAAGAHPPRLLVDRIEQGHDDRLGHGTDYLARLGDLHGNPQADCVGSVASKDRIDLCGRSERPRVQLAFDAIDETGELGG